MTLKESGGAYEVAASVNQNVAKDTPTTSGPNESKNNVIDIGSSNAGFIMDSIGFGEQAMTGLPPPRVRRSASPQNSESGDEIIIFCGRNQKNTHPLKEGSLTKNSDAEES